MPFQSTLCRLLPLALLLPSFGCSRPAAPRRTAADVYADMERARNSGYPDSALQYAHEIQQAHPGTPEAESIAVTIRALDSIAAAAAEAERQRAAAAAAEAEVQRLANKWTYRVSTDPMTSRIARHASISSENTVNFDFPYQGPQHATLTLRQHPSYGRDAILSIEQGQILCYSYDGCTIRVRFDDSPATTWRAASAADNSTTSNFLRAESRFVERMQKSKIVRIQVSIYQEGSPTFEFRVGGFSASRHRGSD